MTPLGRRGSALARKLGIRRGATVALEGLPADLRRELGAALASCRTVSAPEAPVDVALLFGVSRRDLDPTLRSWAPRLASGGALWLAWPKRASGVETDLSDVVVRTLGLGQGLVDVKVCSLNEVWSGLKFVHRRSAR